MNNSLRTYQQELYLSARRALSVNRSVCIQLATGGGKTAIASAMVSSVYDKNKLAWYITPRRNLVEQASQHFKKWNVPHGIINAVSRESLAFNIHVVSKETLVRRWDKIKRWADLIIVDEAHLNYEFQLELFRRAPLSTKFIGYTATPERLSGEGLSVEGGGIYNELIEGPCIPWLMEHDFLCDLKYFSPPLDGLENLHYRGIDYDEEELEQLLQRRKIYGQVIDHYIKYAKGKSALIFCRSVKSAYQTAERFRDQGFSFHTVEGKMPHKKLREILSAHKAGQIQGLTSADLVLYGMDIPRVEFGASLRPTRSRALYMQMIGRLLRPFKDEKTGYVKQYAIWMDHVNMILEHQDENYPGIPLHYVPKINWNFHGREKRKCIKSANILSCPYLDFLYCENPRCSTCEHNPDKSVKDARKPMVVVPAELIEAPHPIPLMDRPPEERREIQDRIGEIAREYNQTPAPGPVGEILQIADDLGYSVFWAYHRLNNDSRMAVNVPLLAEIARQKNYKPGWIYFAKQKVRYFKKEREEVGA